MISFKSFITAIHEAILGANDALMEKNLELLDVFFEGAAPRFHEHDDDGSPDEVRMKINPEDIDKHANEQMKPKSVILQFPHLKSDGTNEMVDIHVPLLTLVPLNMSQVDEAKLTADFEMLIANDELQLNFGKGDGDLKARKFRNGKNKTFGRLEITIKPSEMSDGFKEIVDSYEQAIKAQIPH